MMLSPLIAWDGGILLFRPVPFLWNNFVSALPRIVRSSVSTYCSLWSSAANVTSSTAACCKGIKSELVLP